MNVLSLPRSTRFLPSRFLDGICQDKLFGKLESIQEGYLEVESPEGEVQRFGNPSSAAELRAFVKIHRRRAFSRMVLGGSVGSGESYVDQDWDCLDLVSLIRILVLNRKVLNAIDGGFGALLQPLLRRIHVSRANHELQAHANIQAHYDLGNDFFSLFLDETKMYSSGFFLTESSTLQEAQIEKNDRLCRRLELQPEHHLLEIGTGWGGFAEHAALHYGCRVTTTTISREQFAFAEERIRKLGLQDRVEIIFQDYRNLTGKYDRLVSIEMIEAVGGQFLDTYFAKCSSLLKDNGRMALQSILIRDQYYEQALKSVDFIQAHIFPGSTIPSTSRILESVRDHTDFALSHFEEFGSHYAKTLQHWSKNLEAHSFEITQLGYPGHLLRLWRYYFAYCEGGFREKQIGVAHLILDKPAMNKRTLKKEFV